MYIPSPKTLPDTQESMPFVIVRNNEAFSLKKNHLNCIPTLDHIKEDEVKAYSTISFLSSTKSCSVKNVFGTQILHQS